MKVNEFDVVKLKSGEEATVLEVFADDARDIHYDVEIPDEDNIRNVSAEDIVSVVYRAS